MPTVLPNNKNKKISIITEQFKTDVKENGDKKLQYIASLIVSLSALCTGTTIAWTSQISGALLNGELGFKLSVDELGWAGSLMPLGAAFSTPISGLLGDHLGRKRSMLVLAATMILGWFLMAFSSNSAMLYIGRFITGMVSGGFCLLGPLYCSEISQKEIRGFTGCLTQLNMSSGSLLATVVSKYLSVVNFTIFCGILPVVFAVTFAFMPESPVYLLKKNRLVDARDSLRKFRGPHFNVDHEITEIRCSLQDTRENILQDIKLSMRKTATKKASIISVGVMILKVFTGIDGVLSYASYNFQEAGVSIDEQTSTIILMGISAGSGILQTFVVDKLGRRILLLASDATMTICLLIVSITLFLKKNDIIPPEYHHIAGYVPLICLCTFMVGYSIGLGPIPWMLSAEIFPQEIKSFAASVSNVIAWTFSFVVTKTFLIMIADIGIELTYIIFVGFGIIGIFFIHFFVLETKEKSFQEIQDELEGKSKVGIVP